MSYASGAIYFESAGTYSGDANTMQYYLYNFVHWWGIGLH